MHAATAHARFTLYPVWFVDMYKKAWVFIGLGLFALISAVNVVQFYEPAAAFVALLIAGGIAFILEGVDQRKRWVASVRESRRRFSY